jgi:hypothetical protein
MAKASMGLARRLLVILALVLAILAMLGTRVIELGTIKELALGLGALANRRAAALSKRVKRSPSRPTEFP